MKNVHNKISGDLIIDFLTKIINVNNEKQHLYDNRASILLAANAILLASITNFGIPIIQRNMTNAWGWAIISFAIIGIFLAILSIILTIQIIAPIAHTQSTRKKNLDLEPQESNLFFFIKIAEYKKQEYSEKVKKLSEDKIIEQLLSEVHNVSRLLAIRLLKLKFAYQIFLISVAFWGLLAIGSIFI